MHTPHDENIISENLRLARTSLECLPQEDNVSAKKVASRHLAIAKQIKEALAFGPDGCYSYVGTKFQVLLPCLAIISAKSKDQSYLRSILGSIEKMVSTLEGGRKLTALDRENNMLVVDVSANGLKDNEASRTLVQKLNELIDKIKDFGRNVHAGFRALEDELPALIVEIYNVLTLNGSGLDADGYKVLLIDETEDESVEAVRILDFFGSFFEGDRDGAYYQGCIHLCID